MVPRILSEVCGEHGAASGNAAFYGANRYSKNFGDFRVVEIADIAQHHRDAEIFGKRRQGGVDQQVVTDGVDACC